MTTGTGHADVRTGQWERRKVVIEGGGLPGRSGVTGRAVRSIPAAVTIVGGVTGITGGGRTLELHILVAASAGHSGMCTGQLEDRIVVVESGGLPAAGGVTGFALSAERAAVRVTASAVAGGTGRGRAVEYLILVALVA